MRSLGRLVLIAAAVGAQKMPSRSNTRLVVIAGAGKCGTNALSHHLSEVAGFRMTRAVAAAQKKLNGFPGEVNYPCHLIGAARKTMSGLVGKEAQLPLYGRVLQRSKKSNELALDKSPNYLGEPACAGHLRNAYPEARVFATICPVASRLWSRMNHVNRERKADSADGDLSKTSDWPQHVVAVAREQLQKLEANDWNATTCRSGHATHVCKVLQTSRWHSQVSAFLEAFGAAQFDLWLMEELLTTPSAEIQAHLRYVLGFPFKNSTDTKSKKHVVVHSNANYRNYKLEAGNKHFRALKQLLDARYADDTRQLADLFPQKKIGTLWAPDRKEVTRPGQRRTWQLHEY